jgi:hypothetical protein
MIITNEAQQKVVEKYRKNHPANFDKVLGFKDGMEAMWILVTDTDKAAKKKIEHLKKLHEHYDHSNKRTRQED